MRYGWEESDVTPGRIVGWSKKDERYLIAVIHHKIEIFMIVGLDTGKVFPIEGYTKVAMAKFLTDENFEPL